MPLIGQGDATPHGGYRYASVHCCTIGEQTDPPTPDLFREYECCLIGHIFVMGIGRGRSQVSVFQKAGGGFSFPVLDIDSDWSTVWKGFWGTIGDLMDKAKAAGEALTAAKRDGAGPMVQLNLARALEKALNSVMRELNKIGGAPAGGGAAGVTGGEWSDPGTGTPAGTQEELYERLRGLWILLGGSNGDGTAGDPTDAPDPSLTGAAASLFGLPGPTGKPAPGSPIITGPGLRTTGTIILKGPGRKCPGPATVNWELIGARPSRTITSPYGPGYTFPAKPGRLKLTGSCPSPQTIKFAILGNNGRAISGPWNQDPQTRGLAGDLISMFGGDLDPGILPTGAEITNL